MEGHVARKWSERNAYRILPENFRVNKTGRRKHRSESNMKI